MGGSLWGCKELVPACQTATTGTTSVKFTIEDLTSTPEQFLSLSFSFRQCTYADDYLRFIAGTGMS